MSLNCRLRPRHTNWNTTFSNPNAKMIKERLFPFIEQLQKAHPDIPLIFQQTIRRETRNFDVKRDQAEQAKQDMAAELMKEACKKYKNVYFIDCTDAADALQETSADGTLPGDYGYSLWAKSIEKPLLKILKSTVYSSDSIKNGARLGFQDLLPSSFPLITSGLLSNQLYHPAVESPFGKCIQTDFHKIVT